MKNSLKERWEAGETTLNAWLNIPSSWSAEIIANCGFDSVTIDLQHGLHTTETAMQMTQAIENQGAMPFARLPWNDEIWTQRMLDAGIVGVICPMINTKAECEKFVDSCLYPPLGCRSYGPTRPRLSLGPDYVTFANDYILSFAMIETAEALENIDAILSVPHLTGIFVGPSDLSFSINGEFGLPLDTSVFESILSKTKEVGKFAGIWCGSAEFAQSMKALGYNFITLRHDSSLLTSAAQEIINQVKSG